MKRFTSIATAIAGMLAVLGVGCLIAAFAMGLSWKTVVEMAEQGKFSINIGDHHIGIVERIYQSSDENNVSNEVSSEECLNLDIELSAGSLEIYYDDVEKIQVKQNNIGNFESYLEDNTLHIEAGKLVGINEESGKVVVIIPKEKTFAEVDLEIGAGVAKISNLVADTLQAEIGAGQAEFTNLSVNQLDAETGAGQLQIELNGKESDYSYNIECGIGEIQIGSNSYGGLGKSEQRVNEGTGRLIDLECGIGEIQVEFTE